MDERRICWHFLRSSICVCGDEVGRVCDESRVKVYPLVNDVIECMTKCEFTDFSLSNCVISMVI